MDSHDWPCTFLLPGIVSLAASTTLDLSEFLATSSMDEWMDVWMNNWMKGWMDWPFWSAWVSFPWTNPLALLRLPYNLTQIPHGRGLFPCSISGFVSSDVIPFNIASGYEVTWWTSVVFGLTLPKTGIVFNNPGIDILALKCVSKPMLVLY